MFQEESPVAYAGDLLSGLARWIPGSRSNLPTARLWFRNWLREVIRQRALPMPLFVLNGIAGLALAMERLDLAALLPLAFVCMLRTSEIYSLRKSDVAFSPSRGSAIIALRQTKTSGPNTEECVLHDPYVVKALAQLCEKRTTDQLLYSRPAKFLSEDLKWLCKLVGFSHSRLTPYSLRRGGATWHMHTFGSLSTTALLGRWRQERTAKIYIDGAAAEWASWQFSEEAQKMLRRGTKIFKRKFARCGKLNACAWKDDEPSFYVLIFLSRWWLGVGSLMRLLEARNVHSVVVVACSALVLRNPALVGLLSLGGSALVDPLTCIGRFPHTLRMPAHWRWGAGKQSQRSKQMKVSECTERGCCASFKAFRYSCCKNKKA